jgi:hypothetical protein
MPQRTVRSTDAHFLRTRAGFVLVHVSPNDGKHKRRPKQLLKAIKKQQHDRRIRRFLQERRWPFF